MPNIDEVQLFAERCTGSNFLESLLASNLPTLKITRTYGNKHWLSPEFLNETCFSEATGLIILARSPFAWLRSIHRTPWHTTLKLRKADFSSFIRSQWVCVIDEHAGVSASDARFGQAILKESHPEENGRPFSNILEMRSVKHRIWLDRLDPLPNFSRIRYEDLLLKPEMELKPIAEMAGENLPVPLRVTRAYKGKLSWKKKLFNELPFQGVGFYKPKPLYPLSMKDIDFIQNELDPEVESRLGYDLIKLAEQERERTRSTG